METNGFEILYQGQTLQVEGRQDVNQELYYKVTFPDKEQVSAIKFAWYGLTAFGEPAEMGSVVLEGYGGGFDDDILRAGKSSTNTWNISSRNAKKIVIAWRKEVVCEDGTKWEISGK